MNQQETFEAVVRHLFAQGKPAYQDDGNTCAYRGSDDTKCAIGALIPDSMYLKEMDKNVFLVDELFLYYPKLRERLGEDNKELLRALQWVHDDNAHWESTETMKLQLTAAAIDHGLDVGFMDELRFEDR